MDADFAKAPAGYRAVWSTFDNATDATERIGESSGRTTELVAPAGLPRGEGAFVKVSIGAVGGSHPTWAAPVEAYFRLGPGGWQLVGFEQMPEAK